MIKQYPPNQLPDDTINEFREIYNDEFGVMLSYGDAQLRAKEVLRLFQILDKPLPGEDVAKE